jgi:iron(III) transport system substrate-binding protein
VSGWRRLGIGGLVLLAACAPTERGRTVVTIYSPHTRELLAYVEEAFERADSTVDIQWVDMGSPEVLSRLRAERDAPRADLWFGAPAETFDRAAAEGLLQPYRPSWADRAPADAHHPQDLWYGTYLTPQGIAYRRAAVAAADAPRDWPDVLHPRWAGRIILREPTASGTMRAIFGATLLRSLDTTGSTAAGWEYLRRLHGATREYALSPTILYQHLANGDGDLTLHNLPDLTAWQERTGAAVEVVLPASGTPVVVDAIALVAGAPNPDAARRVYEFITAPASLVHAAQAFHRLPVREDLPATALPAWVARTRAALRPWRLDRQMLADSLDGWMAAWEATFRGGTPR